MEREGKEKLYSLALKAYGDCSDSVDLIPFQWHAGFIENQERNRGKRYQAPVMY